MRILVMLHRAEVISHQTGVAMQLHPFLRQAQMAFRCHEALHELRC